MTVLAPALPSELARSAAVAPIAVTDLTVSYGGRAAIRNVTWNAPTSGLVAIIGPNGAGKSTLLKAILGLVAPSAGKALVYGEPIGRMRRVIAYVAQRTSVDWDFPATALDVVTMGLYRRIGWLRPVRRADRDAAREHLVTVGLADFADRQIGALSGGQQQRVFLARALAQEASIYLLDEPFAGVDAVTERVMIDVLRALRARGKLAVCVHHDLGSVREVFDHVVLLNTQLIASGPIEATFVPDLIARTYGVPIAGGSLVPAP